MGEDKVETRYQFLPSARRGYRPSRTLAQLESEDADGRPELPVELTVAARDKETGEWEEHADKASVRLRMYGPGDIVGVDRRQILRMEPEPETTTLPPNRFPFVEFASADLPWLFSPVKANPGGDGGKARAVPWLCLVVVERDNDDVTFEAEGPGARPVLEAPVEELPPLEEAWAWAHVQVTGEPDPDEMQIALKERGPQGIARLLCPRNLDANTRYRACLVPVFAAGRRAGLGEEPYGEEEGIEYAWTSGSSGTARLPVYHQWVFATGTEGDFPALVRKLSPRDLTEYDVGQTPVDLSDPGAGTTATTEDGDRLTAQLGGALRSVPDGEPEEAEEPPARAEQRDKLLDVLEVGHPEADSDAGLAPDGWDGPVVGPPIYGRWYLPADGEDGPTVDDEGRPVPPKVPGEDSPYRWCHELNTEPVHRIAAGFGTQVIQENQEALMERAWLKFDEIVGDLADSNRNLGRRQVADAAGERLHEVLERLDEDVLGMASRVRDLLSAQAEIARTGALADEGPMGWRLHGGDRRTGNPAQGPPAFGPAERAQRSTLAAKAAARRRMLNAASPKLRGLAQVDGKLHPSGRAGSATPGAERLRPPREVDERARIAGRLENARSRLSPHRLALLQTAGPGQDTVGETSWRIGPDGQVLSLSEAFRQLPPEEKPVPKTVLQVQAARNHAASVHRVVSKAKGWLSDGGPPSTLEAFLQAPVGGGQLAEQAAAIRENTFAPLERQVSKLVAARPEPVDDELTHDRKRELLDRLYEAHAGLTDAMDALVEPRSTRSGTGSDALEAAIGGDPAGDEGELEAVLTVALDELAAIDEVLTTILSYIDPGVPGDGQGEADRPVRYVEPASVEDGLEATQAHMLEGNDQLPGLLDASRWAELRAALDIHPGLLNRELPLGRIMASPIFPDPMYRPLLDLGEERFLPGIGEVPKETIGALLTNQAFVEAYMCGVNHEMARELFWRRYPTDRRGTYFQRFWPYPDDADPDLDIDPLHMWRTNGLGENAPAGGGDNLVFLLKGEVIHAYPNTRIYAVPAVRPPDGGPRVPLLESLRMKLMAEDEGDDLPNLDIDTGELDTERWQAREPIFRGRIHSNIQFVGFDLSLEDARAELEATDQDGGGADETHDGWFLVLEEPFSEPRFGLNVPVEDEDRSDFEDPPYGVRAGGEIDAMDEEAHRGQAQSGWNALSWGHLVEDPAALEAKTYVRVGEERPAGDEGDAWAVEEGTAKTSGTDPETFDATDAATWGHNSAHMAHIALRLPVRVCVHFDDILPDLAADDEEAPS